MNILYILLIALCFSAGFLTKTLSTNNSQVNTRLTNDKNISSKSEQIIEKSVTDDVKPLNIFSE